MSHHTQQNLPTRTVTNDDDAVPDEDTSETTKLFLERLQAWKHACGYLEDYVEATEKMQHAHAKEYEKALKSVSHPLKEGNHFDQSLGGIAGMFDNIRTNTQGLANSHTETAKALKGTVLPMFERLHTEIKHKNKEISKGAGKGAKMVDKARNTSQKHIELLGEKTAAFDSQGGKITAHDDPYVLQRGVYHRLNKQIQEENANRQDMIAVQNSFAQFEAHIINTFQHGMTQFNQVLARQAESTRGMYGDMTATSSRISPDFEWNGFMQRNGNLLIDPHGPARSIEKTSFPNQDHRATKPLIAGTLEKKGKLLSKYDTFYYVITPSKFLHEYKTDDDFAKDPTPELSLYLPDCVIGALDGAKFNVKGKDASKSSFANKLSMAHELKLKAHTNQDADKWYECIRSVCGETSNEMPEPDGVSRSNTSGSTAASGYPQTMEEKEAAHANTIPGTGAPAADTYDRA
ncbi:hypothetical protein MBLNU457_4633t1 [Dothideomycetes sp. NU457]